MLVAAACIRSDLAGVTSIVRALALSGKYYPSLLGMFHSKGINHDKLTQLWVKSVMKLLESHIECYEGRPVFVADGTKISKTGRKIPGIKKLHQSSDNNNKANYIFGHSCQAISVLVRSGIRHVALPLRCMIHEGVIFEQDDSTLTLLDKLVSMTKSLGVAKPSILVADAYYTSAKIILPLQGMLQVIAIKHTKLAWRYYGSWIRTIRSGVLPSERVVALAMRNSLPEFLTGTGKECSLALFLRERIDLTRSDGTKLIA